MYEFSELTVAPLHVLGMEAALLAMQDVTSRRGRVRREGRGIETEKERGGTDTGTRTGIAHAPTLTLTPTRARRRGNGLLL